MNKENKKIKEIKESNDYKSLLTHHNVVIDMYADWCGPCKRIAPEFESLSNDKTYKHVHFAKLNVDEMESMNLPIQEPDSIPCFLIIKNGVVVHKVQGANLQAIKQAIETYLK